jgi:hypothetical protein
LTDEKQEKLINSLLAKVPQNFYQETSINKLFKRVLKIFELVISDQKFWRILSESKKLDPSGVRSTGEFITLCQPDKDEKYDLMETGNFRGQTGWISGQAKNLPPNQSSNEITPTNTFESDVLGVTSVDDSSAPE